MDGAPSALAALLWFGVVVAAIPLALWLLRRTPVGAAGTAAGAMRTVATLAVGPGQRLLTVEVGHGEQRRWLVLGVTAQQITALHEMAPAGEPAAATADAAMPFVHWLAQARPRAKADRAA